MHTIVRYGDIIGIAAAGIALAAAGAPTGVWIAWGVCAVIVAAARTYRHHLNRK